MQGDVKVIEDLNEVLKAELTAINQYFCHAEMCENWGYGKLATYVRKEAIDEMRHAEALIERILFLEGIPNMSDMFPIKIGKDVKVQLENDMALELQAIPRLNTAINHAVAANDNASRELFEKILVDEEQHVDWLEAQLGMIEEMGIGVYLSQQIHEDAQA
ncbi:MAG: bacterioferritin [Solibacterales bacterium]|nr:bacterioferritin [Bryobacterales bacterium]|tara:strand:+ start:10935 stop:11417 length:483 start_codon:yes stop_codon:yes gene_type:complete